MKKIKLIKILAGFFALMLLFTFLSRAADSVNVDTGRDKNSSESGDHA